MHTPADAPRGRVSRPAALVAVGLLLAIGASAALAAAPEAAGAAPGHVVNLGPVVASLGELVVTALVGLAGIGLRRGFKYLGIREDDRIRGYLETALLNGLQLALERALQRRADTTDVLVRQQMVADAANYAAARVPDALKRFGLTKESVQDLLTARLPTIAPHPGQQVVFGETIPDRLG